MKISGIEEDDGDIDREYYNKNDDKGKEDDESHYFVHHQFFFFFIALPLPSPQFLIKI